MVIVARRLDPAMRGKLVARRLDSPYGGQLAIDRQACRSLVSAAVFEIRPLHADRALASE
jgi:hypothetical protein